MFGWLMVQDLDPYVPDQTVVSYLLFLVIQFIYLKNVDDNNKVHLVALL